MSFVAPLIDMELSMLFEIDDLKIPVCSLEILIRMKETIRDRDMRDLRFLKKKAEERKRDGL